MLNLSKFTAEAWHRSTPWAGSGHTTATEPARRGWRLRPCGGPGPFGARTWILSRAGLNRCFTIEKIGGALDVAYYLESARIVVETISTGGTLDAQYVQVIEAPGWALRFIQQAEAKVNYIEV